MSFFALVKTFTDTFTATELDQLPDNIQTLYISLVDRINEGKNSIEQIKKTIANLIELVLSTTAGKKYNDFFAKAVSYSNESEKKTVLSNAETIFKELISNNKPRDVQSKDEKKTRKEKITKEKLMALAKLYFFLAHIGKYMRENKEVITFFDATAAVSNAYMITHSFNKKQDVKKRITGDKEKRRKFFASINSYRNEPDAYLFKFVEEFVASGSKDENHYLISVYHNLLNNFRQLAPANVDLKLKEMINLKALLQNLFKHFFQLPPKEIQIFVKDFFYDKTEFDDGRIYANINDFKEFLYSEETKYFDVLLRAHVLQNEYGYAAERIRENGESRAAIIWHQINEIVINIKAKGVSLDKGASIGRGIPYRAVIKAIVNAYFIAIGNKTDSYTDDFLKDLAELIDLLRDKKSSNTLIYNKLEKILNNNIISEEDNFFINLLAQCNMLVCDKPTPIPVAPKTIQVRQANISSKPAAATVPKISFHATTKSILGHQRGAADLFNQKRAKIEEKRTARVRASAKFKFDGRFNNRRISFFMQSRIIDNKKVYKDPTFYNLLNIPKDLVKDFLLKLPADQRAKLLPEIKQQFTIKSRFTLDTLETPTAKIDSDDERLQHQLSAMGISLINYDSIHDTHAKIFSEYSSAQASLIEQRKDPKADTKAAEARLQKAEADANAFCMHEEVYKIFVIKYCDRELGPIAAMLYAQYAKMDLSIWYEDDHREIVILCDTNPGRTEPAKVNLYYRGANEFEVLDLADLPENKPAAAGPPKLNLN